MGGSYSAGFFCALNESLVLGAAATPEAPFLQANPLRKSA